MRSMTQTSADIFNAFHYPLPTTPSRRSSEPTRPTCDSSPVNRDTPSSILTRQFPLTNQHSFFDVESNTLLLSPQSKRHVTRALQNGWAKTTVSRYSGAIKQFIRFCDTEGIPGHLRFPADEFVLCAFAASSAGIHSRSTPQNRLSALKAWHIAHNMEWKGSSRLRYVLNGVHNLAPRNSRRPPRPPVNAIMISQLIERLDPNSSLDIAIGACAVTAFWGQCRLGELLPSSLSFTPTSFPARLDFKESVRNSLAYVIHLPQTKTRRHGQEVVLVSQRKAIDPIRLLKRHLHINHTPDHEHLFSYSSPQGFIPLTKPVFLRRCNEIWHSLGYPRTTGHCFRIGGTTELLIAGIPPEVVKATGRWSSDSFMRYWHSLDDIAPQYIRRLHTRKRKLRQG
jgi:hypothetical protein